MHPWSSALERTVPKAAPSRRAPGGAVAGVGPAGSNAVLPGERSPPGAGPKKKSLGISVFGQREIASFFRWKSAAQEVREVARSNSGLPAPTYGALIT